MLRIVGWITRLYRVRRVSGDRKKGRMGGQGLYRGSPSFRRRTRRLFEERNARDRKLFFNSDISDIRLPPTRVNTAIGV